LDSEFGACNVPIPKSFVRILGVRSRHCVLEWLEEGKPSPTGRYTFAMWRLWRKNDALLESGLLGPVNLIAVGEVEVVIT
jgi:hypothetical protein